MTAVAKPYSLLKRLTVAFSIVALLAFALVGGFLYNALALELQRRDDMEIAELSRLGRVLEDHFGQPQDVEWAYQDGQLYLLQSRPVTA